MPTVWSYSGVVDALVVGSLGTWDRRNDAVRHLGITRHYCHLMQQLMVFDNLCCLRPRVPLTSTTATVVHCAAQAACAQHQRYHGARTIHLLRRWVLQVSLRHPRARCPTPAPPHGRPGYYATRHPAAADIRHHAATSRQRPPHGGPRHGVWLHGSPAYVVTSYWSVLWSAQKVVRTSE